VAGAGADGLLAQAPSPSAATANATTEMILTNFTKIPLLSLHDARETLLASCVPDNNNRSRQGYILNPAGAGATDLIILLRALHWS